MNKSFTRDSKKFQAGASMALAAILVFTLSRSLVISIAFSLLKSSLFSLSIGEPYY